MRSAAGTGKTGYRKGNGVFAAGKRSDSHGTGNFRTNRTCRVDKIFRHPEQRVLRAVAVHYDAAPEYGGRTRNRRYCRTYQTTGQGLGRYQKKIPVPQAGKKFSCRRTERHLLPVRILKAGF